MGSAITNITQANFVQFKGKTTALASNGSNAAYMEFRLDKPAEFNFKINNNFTNVQIMDERNHVVAQLSSQTDAVDVSARLGAGNYRAVVSQANRLAGVRDFSLDIAEKKNVLMTSGGALLSATAQPPQGADSGVQKHTINVVQGGTFTSNFTLPNARWAMMDKDGKVVASSETGASEAPEDFFKKPSYKIDPGQYEMVVVPSSKLAKPTPFQLSFVPRVESAQAAANEVQESAISKTLRERESRLQQWASETKTTSTSA